MVPIGGTVGAWIGATDGGTTAQTVGGQIGERSIELLQIGCISPLTQRQTHAADAGPTSEKVKNTATKTKNRFSMNRLIISVAKTHVTRSSQPGVSNA